MLARSDPERSAQLLDLAQRDIDERWRYYEQLAGRRAQGARAVRDRGRAARRSGDDNDDEKDDDDDDA